MGFLRNLTKSDEERRQEVLTAYLDDNLSPKDKQQFEQLLYSDESLRRDLEQQRSIKQAMAQLPRMRAPRSFTLDPSLYGTARFQSLSCRSDSHRPGHVCFHRPRLD